MSRSFFRFFSCYRQKIIYLFVFKTQPFRVGMMDNACCANLQGLSLENAKG